MRPLPAPHLDENVLLAPPGGCRAAVQCVALLLQLAQVVAQLEAGAVLKVVWQVNEEQGAIKKIVRANSQYLVCKEKQLHARLTAYGSCPLS